MANRPLGRKKNVTGGGSGVHKRGEGLGIGPVGAGGYGSGSSPASSGPSGGRMNRGGGRSPLFFIIIVIVLILGGGGGLGSLLGGFGGDDSSLTSYAPAPAQTTTTTGSSGTGSSGLSSILGSFLGGGVYSEESSAAWSGKANTGILDKSVASAARAKRTTIKVDGKDVITIMVYMCGTDLESRGAMASKDLQEMLAANIGEQINLIIYTGGCKR